MRKLYVRSVTFGFFLAVALLIMIGLGLFGALLVLPSYFGPVVIAASPLFLFGGIFFLALAYLVFEKGGDKILHLRETIQ